jgi:hypothetical protein
MSLVGTGKVYPRSPEIHNRSVRSDQGFQPQDKYAKVFR